jgi:hypothetical protein
MKLGLVYPQIELGGDPEAVRTLGRGAEQLGYDYLLASRRFGARTQRMIPFTTRSCCSRTWQA